MNLTKEQISRLEYGKSQFPWLEEKIDNLIKNPTKKGFEEIVGNLSGTLKSLVESLIKG